VRVLHVSMITVSGACYALLNVFLLVICVVYIAVRAVLGACWWCVKTPVLFCFYFFMGVKNFVQHGKAQLPEEEEFDPENMFANRRRAPTGPKREPGEGFTTELPKNTEDSIKRLLSLANKDCYTVMGVTPDANQADIKKVYRQQAILVHPDKTSHPGGDAAFKILAQAFETVGDPEKRSEYDEGLITPEQFAEDIETMMRKLYETYSNTLPCAGCNHVHKITLCEGKACSRYCEECREQHLVKENDIWAETKYMGLHISYFACRKGQVFNVSDWIICQGIKIVPNTHVIQCALRNQTKTFDDIMEDWKEEAMGQKKGKRNNAAPEGQQQQPPQQSSKSRRSRKKRKK